MAVDKVAVFIDNGYFKKIQLQLGLRVDYLKFSDYVVGENCERFRTYVYDCPPYQSNPPTEPEKKNKAGFDTFKHNIVRLPRFEFRMGRLQLSRDENGNVLRRKDGSPTLKQKGVDMALGIDVSRLASTKQIQRMVLVAGDSDFVPALEVAKSEGGVLISLYFMKGGPIHDSLYEICDDRFELTEEILKRVRR